MYANGADDGSPTVRERLNRLDERFHVQRGPRLSLREMKELRAATRSGHVEALDPELIRRGRAWARAVLGRLGRRTELALGVAGLVSLLAMVVLALLVDGNAWIYVALMIVSAGGQYLGFRRHRRLAHAIQRTLLPVPLRRVGGPGD